jgi:hypothetical protein
MTPTPSDSNYIVNPPLLSDDQLHQATLIGIAQAQYQFLVASFSLIFTLLTFYFIFKSLLWFYPHFWNRKLQR